MLKYRLTQRCQSDQLHQVETGRAGIRRQKQGQYTLHWKPSYEGKKKAPKGA
jgi:hypothetical protein